MQDSVKVYERNFYSNVLAIPVRYINKQMTRERQSQKNARGCKVLGCRSGEVRVCGIYRHKLLTYQKWNGWAQRKSVISDPKLKILYKLQNIYDAKSNTSYGNK